MKNPTDPRGRVFTIKGRSTWTDEIKRDLYHLDDIPDLPSRTVLVIGKSEDKKGHWKAAFVSYKPKSPSSHANIFTKLIYQITSEKDLALDTDLQLPIRPAKKDKKTGIQLILSHNYQLECGPAWVNLHQIMELPRSVLEEDDELEFALQLKSHNRVRSFMKEMFMAPGL
ncbi:hypothetical protein V8F33_012975 [Rhypophila sp. PSN 637]